MGASKNREVSRGLLRGRQLRFCIQKLRLSCFGRTRLGQLFFNLISRGAELLHRSTHPSGELGQFLRAEQEEYDEKDYHHVRPRKIKDTSDHWSHKSVWLAANRSSLNSTNFSDLYSRRVMCGVVWVGDICEITASPRVFLRGWNKTGPRQSY